MPDMSLERFRSRFPLLTQRVYVNSCSQGALSIDVEEALTAFLTSWRERGSPWDEWVGEVDRLRSTFARSIGAAADEVAVVPSASDGISAIATALAFQTRRDGVVLGEFEFPTMAHVWLAQARRGARIAWARAEGDSLPTEAYATVVDDRTLVVPVTHICYRNGYKLDVASLASLCRDRGALLFLDDYQHTGTAPLDVKSLGVDFMITGCLKYLLGPSGVALLYVRRELIDRLEPAVTGWFGRVDPFAFRPDLLDWSPSARRFEVGTPPVPSVYGATAALGLLDSVGSAAVASQIGRLVDRLLAWAHDAECVVVTPSLAARRGPLVVLRSPDADSLVSRLQARGIIASCRSGGLRIAFHAYNDDSDVDAIIEALEAESALLERRVQASS